MKRSLAARALRGAFGLIVAASLSACAARNDTPLAEVKSVGLAITCGDTLYRAHYDLAYPINSTQENMPIPDWSLTTAARGEVEAALPNAQIGDLQVDVFKLVAADILRKNPLARRYNDYTQAFSGNVESYDYLLAIIPGPAGSDDSPYFGTGLRSRRGQTLFGIEAKVGPLEAHAACRGILYDRRNGTVRHAKSFVHEKLPADISATGTLGNYPPETVARFRAPLDRLVRRSVVEVMAQLIAVPEDAQ